MKNAMKDCLVLQKEQSYLYIFHNSMCLYQKYSPLGEVFKAKMSYIS